MARKDKELTTLVRLSQDQGIPISTLQRAAQRGTLKAWKVGRDWVTTPSAFKEWLANRKMGRPKK